MIEVFSPGIEYYANRIRSGLPFSYLKYGDGELCLAIPGMPLNPRQRSPYEAPTGEYFAETLEECYVDDNYIVALWRQEFFKKVEKGKEYSQWMEDNIPEGVKFHDGMVWIDALFQGKLYHIINAIRQQPLPVVIVGPAELRRLDKVTGWKIVRHIETHRSVVWLEREFVEAEIMGFKKPAFFVICAGPMKILIHKLWTTTGQHSSMIDFGSVFDPLCGYCSRLGFWNLTLGELWRNLGRETKHTSWGLLV